MLLVPKMACATLSTLPCLARPVLSHRGQLLERQALLLPPWSSIDMSLTSTYAAKRELLGAETQPLHSRSSCQGPKVILWPFLEDPDPNMLSGAHTLFYIWAPGLQAPEEQQAEQQSISSLAASKPEKPQTVGLGGTVGATSALQTGLAPAPDTRASWERLYCPKLWSPPEWSVFLQLW